MSLKIATTLSLIYGISLILLMPWVLKFNPGKLAPKTELVEFQACLLAYTASALLSFSASAGFAMTMTFDARQRFLLAKQRNVQALIDEVVIPPTPRAQEKDDDLAQ